MTKKMRFDEALQLMQDNLQATASTVGAFTEAEAKLRAPVLSGHLRRSLTHDTKVEKGKGIVRTGSNVEYAVNVCRPL